jgi:N-acetylmuramoyl-L-alanine amidase
MPDEKRPTDPKAPKGDDLSASTIFVEMMRQAAARRAEMGLNAPPTPPTAPAEPRQPPKHVTPKVESRTVTPPPAEPPTSPTNTNDNESVRPEHLPASRRARPRRETQTTGAVQPNADQSPVTPPSTPAVESRRFAPSQPSTPRAEEEPPQASAREASTQEDSSVSAQDRPLEESRPRPMVRRMPATPPPPAPVDEVDEDEADEETEDTDGEAIQEQRVRRVQRRKERTSRRRAGMIGGFVRTAIIVIIAAGLASTIFTWFTRPDFIRDEVASDLEVARATGVFVMQPTALPTPNYLRKIGVVSGHRGPESDPGAVCPDGLTEAEINFAVAQLVVKNLRAQGYSVDLLDEFDARLDNYQAAAVVSIHANTCQDWGEPVSGFLVAKASARPEGGLDTLLAECVAGQYGMITGLERRYNLTVDMTDYHSFREIHPFTPAAIIELGFLKDDREILTTRQEDMSRAITEGILCFLQPRPAGGGVVTATPGEFFPTATQPTPAGP